MRWPVLVASTLALACGSTGSGLRAGSTSSAIVTGDTCALHQDTASCAADPQGCSWSVNTRPCQIGQPCPAGWCYRPRSDGGGASGGAGSADASCACSSGAGDVCVMQIGGPAVQGGSTAPLTCRTPTAACTAADPCSCLAQGAVERCWSSGQVTNLCICDDGVR